MITSTPQEVSDALAKIKIYRQDFGDWILTADASELNTRATVYREEAAETENVTRRHKLLARAVQLDALAVAIRTAGPARETLIPESPAAYPVHVDEEPTRDPMQMDEEAIIEELTGLTTDFGVDVLVSTGEDYRKMALSAMAQAHLSQGEEVLFHLQTAMRLNHISRVIERADQFDIDRELTINPPQISLQELLTQPAIVPKYQYGQRVFQRLQIKINGDASQIIETFSEGIVIGISCLHDTVRYRLGHLTDDGDTIYPMDGYIDEEDITLTAPSIEETPKRRPDYLKVVK